jgi:polyphosphate:AMP phosphotransferase
LFKSRLFGQANNGLIRHCLLSKTAISWGQPVDNSVRGVFVKGEDGFSTAFHGNHSGAAWLECTMFEVALLKTDLSKREYKQELPRVRTRLLDLQEQLIEARFPVIILVAGADGAGKGDVINALNAWLDPHYVLTHAFDTPSEEERQRPHFWRYWMALPPKARIGILVFAWYSKPMSDRIGGRYGDARLDAELVHINKLEKELVDDGALVIKCWLHLSRKQQERRLKKLDEDPRTRWRVTELDKKHLKLYDKFSTVAERVLRETSTAEAPWLILNGYDRQYRRLAIGKYLVDRMTVHLGAKAVPRPPAETQDPFVSPAKEPNLLSSLDLQLRLEKKEYDRELTFVQEKVGCLTRAARKRKRSTILLFEGWDAAGKGGAIRRITQAMDARDYRVIPIAAPTDEEKAHHYLWRFWRHLPRDGRVTIYDRSWYGRVLVERVEQLARREDWLRAYTEINDFEEQLSDHGIILMKYWIHISKAEQSRRFEKRETTSYKHYKISAEDYRNRDKWEEYERAVNEMVTRTSTEYAPWHLIEGNDKRYARIKVMRLLCRRYGDELA